MSNFVIPQAMQGYTDELSMDLISKAVLTTDLLSYVDLRPGFTAGSSTINLVDTTVPVVAAGCNGYPTDGAAVTYSQVTVDVASLQSKAELCVEDLRTTYLSQFMSAGMGNDAIPFEQVIAESYADQIRKANEGILINGNASAGTTGLKAQITNALGAELQGGTPAAWDATNSIDQALDLYDAIPEEVKDREDLIMVVSPASYRALTRALVAANLNTVNNLSAAVEGNEILILPGTNIKIVKSSGLVNSDYKFAGPAGMIVAMTGLTDELDSFRFFYDASEDIVKFRAAYRLGVGVSQVDMFATNDMA